jgi:hypothetical protein
VNTARRAANRGSITRKDGNKRWQAFATHIWLDGAHGVDLIGYEVQILLLAEPEAIFKHCAWITLCQRIVWIGENKGFHRNSSICHCIFQCREKC